MKNHLSDEYKFMLCTRMCNWVRANMKKVDIETFYLIIWQGIRKIVTSLYVISNTFRFLTLSHSRFYFHIFHFLSCAYLLNQFPCGILESAMFCSIKDGIWVSEHFVIIFNTEIVSKARFRQAFCHHRRVLLSTLLSSSPAKHNNTIFNIYSWNRAFESQATTISNDVNAIYFNVKGALSHWAEIQAK